MPFIKIPGVVGKVYVPQKAGERKHNCKGCYVCQMCGDDSFVGWALSPRG